MAKVFLFSFPSLLILYYKNFQTYREVEQIEQQNSYTHYLDATAANMWLLLYKTLSHLSTYPSNNLS